MIGAGAAVGWSDPDEHRCPPGAHRVVDRAELVEFFSDVPAAHIYAICDLEPPFWSASRWVRRDDALIGVVGLPDGDALAVYAVSTKDPNGTLALLAELAPGLASGVLITGPTGLVASLRSIRKLAWHGPHRRYRLIDSSASDVAELRIAGGGVVRLPPSDTRLDVDAEVAVDGARGDGTTADDATATGATAIGATATEPVADGTTAEAGPNVPGLPAGRPDGAIGSADDGVEPLGRGDLDDLAALYSTDPGAAFFMAHMLDDGSFVGVREGGRLVSAAGTHVLSASARVAAIGAVFTRPSHRGRGLARRVTSGAIARVCIRVDVIGLNVSTRNIPAIALYESLGFVGVLDYDEAELA